MKNRYILPILFLLCAIGLGGCGGQTQETDTLILVEQEKEGEDYDLCITARQDMIQAVTLNCQYTAVHTEGITYHTGGQIIREVMVKEGDHVTAGQLLVSLAKEDIAEQMAELTYQMERTQILLNSVLAAKQSEIDMENLEYSHTNQWYMDLEAHEKQLARIEENYIYIIEDYEDQLYMDELRLKQLEEELNEGKMYAGISGTVVYVKPDLEGSVTVADERIMTITNSTECVFETDRVEEAQYFEEGIPVTIEIPVGTDAGSYEVMPILSGNNTGKLCFRLSGEDSDAQINIGTRGNITVILDERKDALCISPKALHSSDGDYYVYVLDEDGNCRTAWVEIGMRTQSEVEILSGLTEGDKVILQ